MKVELYELLARQAISRRNLMKGAAGVSAAALAGPALMGMASQAFAADDLRAQILKVPGLQ